MDPFTILAIVLGIVGTVSSVITNATNIKNANEQLEDQQSFSHDEAELANKRAIENYWATQSPASRVKQLKDAGLSVGLMYGGSAAGGGVNAGTQATTPSANLPVMQNPFSDGLSELIENLKKGAETENIGIGTEKEKEEINKIKSEIEVNNATIEQIATEINATEIMTSNAKLDGTLKQIEIEVSGNTKQDRINIVATQLQNMQNEGYKMLKEIESLKIDNDNKERIYNATIKKMSAETALTWKQVTKTEAETWLTKATTALTTEQTNLTFSQRQKTLKEIKNMQNLMAKIDAEIKLIEEQTGKVKLEKVSEVIGWINDLSKIANEIANIALKGAFIK